MGDAVNAKAGSTLRRYSAGLAGQIFARGVYAAYTVFLVPLLIHAWGVQGYGEWVTLTAVASYFAYTNFGLVTTSANEIVMATSANDVERARKCFVMALNTAFLIVAPAIAACVLIAIQLDLTAFLNLSAISETTARAIIALCGAQLLFTTIRGVIVAVLYSDGRYAFAYTINGGVKLAELCFLFVAVTLAQSDPSEIATIITACTAVELLIVALAIRKTKWARPDLTTFCFSWVRAQVKPALGFMLSNLSSQGLLVQGPRVLIGATLGGHAVGVFSVYSTAARLLDQFLLVGIMPLEVEVARSIGRGDKATAYRLVGLATQVSWLLFFVVAGALMLSGPLLFSVWTQNELVFTHSFMALLLLVSAGNVLGRVSAHALIGTNMMYRPAVINLVVALLALTFAAVLVGPMGIIGVVLATAAGEFLYSTVVIRTAAEWLDATGARFVRDQLRVGIALRQLTELARRIAEGSGTGGTSR